MQNTERKRNIKISRNYDLILKINKVSIYHSNVKHLWPITRTIGEVNPENGLTLGLA